MTIVDAKRVLSDFSVPAASKTRSVKAEQAEGTGLTFAEMSAERKRNIQCFGCSEKGHFLSDCKKTTTKKKAGILAMVKPGDFKTTKGVVQLNTGKGGDKSVKPPEDNDVERFEDFVGEQHMNVGKFELVDEPDYDANPFGFFGINFGEFGEESPPEADPQGGSTQTGVSLTDVNSHKHKEVRFKASSGGKRLTLDGWKVHLDSCATYHTFSVKEFLRNIK